MNTTLVEWRARRLAGSRGAAARLPDSLYGVLRRREGTGGCGRARGVKARERRVWTVYRRCCETDCARGLRSWARVLTLGSPYMWRTSLARSGIGGRRRALLLMGSCSRVKF